MAYLAYVAPLKNVQKDPNSENLYTATVMGEGVIVGASSCEGQDVLYLPADGQVDYEFAMAFGLLRKDKNGQPAGGYLDETRHIKAIKLRGLRSEGIAIPIEKVFREYPALMAMTPEEWKEGFNKIGDYQFCKKYVPRGRRRNGGGAGGATSYRGKKAAGIIYPEFAMHSDTGQLAYNESAFYPGDLISISLKVHGTSQRSMRTYAEYPRGFFRRLFGLKAKRKPVYVCGTRRVVMKGATDGYYDNNEFRQLHHDHIAPHVKDGMEVFYEVVGWTGPKGTTIMPTCDNRKLKDKAFVKKYGDTTTFTYGCDPIGRWSDMFVYRITENGREYTPTEIMSWCNKAMVKHCPIICDDFEFTTWDDLLARVNAYFEDLTDPIDGTHIKEGVIVRIVEREGRTLPFRAFKSKTYEFKVLEGIIKESATEADMEEAQDDA